MLANKPNILWDIHGKTLCLVAGGGWTTQWETYQSILQHIAIDLYHIESSSPSRGLNWFDDTWNDHKEL